MGREGIEDTYPLTPTQHGMLFQHLYAQQSGVNIEQMLCTLQEDLNVPAFTYAWEQVVERHTALRTSFRWQGHEAPVQQVHGQVTLPCEQHDWRGMSPQTQQQHLHAYVQADRTRGFDLTTAPLMRLALFRLAETDYRCLWTFHHIIADGRSHLLILQDLFAVYDAFCQGQDMQLAPTRPYGDYIRWLHQQELVGSEAFWRQLLQGFRAPTPLPMIPPVSAPLDHGTERGEQERRLSVQTTAALQSLAQRHHLTLNTMVQGAWALLLGRYSGEEDVVLGAVRAGRRATIAGAESMVGVFINTLPIRASLEPTQSLLPWLHELRAQGVAVREHEHTPLVQVQAWSNVPSGRPLFESLLVFDTYLLQTALRAQGGNWEKREFQLLEKTNYPLTVYAYAEPALLLKIAYDRPCFADATITNMLRHLQTVLESMAADPAQCLADIPLLAETERHQVLVEWNATHTDFPTEQCLHQSFAAQVRRTPDAVAVIYADQQLTYQELYQRANQLAHHLQNLGVGPEVLVGLYAERSLEMLVGLLGILTAGGAYVPLDPTYPQERLAFMLEDAQVPVLLTQQRLVKSLPQHAAHVVCLDMDWPSIAKEPSAAPASGVIAANLAYVIYTSGSTGKPKGVMVEHRNVMNCFAGMDACIDHDPPGVWLAVTSISFDIAVLELFWTLTRGFRVVLYGEHEAMLATDSRLQPTAEKGLEFSLFYFASNDAAESKEKYTLLLEGARFADQHGFAAVWTPERHFHAFGGLYPNPAVTSAALATITQHVQLRAGSVVLPLQNPIRVAEEWAVVDNLSQGRVGVSFASGWHANDFVLAPDNYAARRHIMVQDIATVRQLWRGEAVRCRSGAGSDVAVKIFPQPVQPELPIWLTAAGNPETFRQAGAIGANVLTHLLGQNLDSLAQKIALYRQAWHGHGHGPGDGHVTLMLHTFVGEDVATVREHVRQPLLNYLKSSSDLVQQLVHSLGHDNGVAALGEADMQSLWERAFERYFTTSGLFGTLDTCLEMIAQLKAIGVDEVACLIDFGVAVDAVLTSLSALHRLKEHSNAKRYRHRGSSSLSEQLVRHGVTHLQCTPSMARMLLLEPEAPQALSRLRQLLLGGESLPVALVEQLWQVTPAKLCNMYGPTETTIWSTTYTVAQVERTVPIGRPIANTDIYILDRYLRPVPIGVPGELYIGGAGVVRGYLRQPALTEERFIPHPFNSAPTTRLYRTGDVARYRPDGDIEFLGRHDHQVKLRGYRLELGEIETVLEQHPAVHEAVALVREDVPGAARLVVYLSAVQHPAPTADTLREFLRTKLPEYMVPAVFVLLDALPLTPNGKVDRRALPPPEHTAAPIDRGFVAPRTPTEAVLAHAWATLLVQKQVGIYDNFFDLGGHSLLATQLVSEVRDEFQVTFPLRCLFEKPTVAGMAETIERLQIEQADASELATVLRDLGKLSDEEVARLLAYDGQAG